MQHTHSQTLYHAQILNIEKEKFTFRKKVKEISNTFISKGQHSLQRDVMSFDCGGDVNFN